MNIQKLLGVIAIFMILTGCGIAFPVNCEDLTGVSLTIPEQSVFTSYAKDTVDYDLVSRYKILVYADSLGCMSCKLRLDLWKDFMAETQIIAPGQADFIFVVAPFADGKREVHLMLKGEHFELPVCIDYGNQWRKINPFLADKRNHVLLLDSLYRIVEIGNPLSDVRVRDAFFNHIMP